MAVDGACIQAQGGERRCGVADGCDDVGVQRPAQEPQLRRGDERDGGGLAQGYFGWGLGFIM